MDTQPHEIFDEENILAFIAALDDVCETNETGWTHEKASWALVAKRRRRQSGPDGHSTETSTFDFFSHFNSTLRNHLRQSYNCRMRRGYTGDAQQGLSSDVATLQIVKLHALMNVIGVAIDTPARESHGQVLGGKAREDMEKDNRQLDEFDQKFNGTWKGVLTKLYDCARLGCAQLFTQENLGLILRESDQSYSLSAATGTSTPPKIHIILSTDAPQKPQRKIFLFRRQFHDVRR